MDVSCEELESVCCLLLGAVKSIMWKGVSNVELGSALVLRETTNYSYERIGLVEIDKWKERLYKYK